MWYRLKSLWYAIKARLSFISKQQVEAHEQVYDLIQEAIEEVAAPDKSLEINADAFFLHLYKIRKNVEGEYVGLNVSSDLTVQALKDAGWKSESIGVADDNGIDRVLFTHRPSHLIIKAFWVRTEKLEFLAKKYPSCQFIVCCHSKPSFLAMERSGFDRLLAVARLSETCPNVKVAANNFETALLIQRLFQVNCVYLPNVIPYNAQAKVKVLDPTETLKVGIFCSIRPLKNVINQALAAVQYAQLHDRKLELHVITSRFEMGGESTVFALRSIFQNLNSNLYKLVEHDWMDHEEFGYVIRQMDIGLQVSFTESFNIVVMDFMNQGVPIVTSPAIDWTPQEWQAQSDSIEDIVVKMELWLSSDHNDREGLLRLGLEAAENYHQHAVEVYNQLQYHAKKW